MKKIVYLLINVLQVLTFIGVFILEYLSKRKGGVNHHLIARKYQLKEGIYSDFNLIIFFVIMLTLAGVLYLIAKKYRKYNLSMLEILKLTIITVFFGACIINPSIKALNGYVYLLSSTIFVYALQLIPVIKDFKLNKNVS